MKVFKSSDKSFTVELEETEQEDFAAVVASIGVADHEVMIMVIRRGLLGMMADVAEAAAHNTEAEERAAKEAGGKLPAGSTELTEAQQQAAREATNKAAAEAAATEQAVGGGEAGSGSETPG